MARELIAQLDKAQESRQLTEHETQLRAELKKKCLGLALLSRTIARSRSRIRFLAEGDANTKFFHLQACHRSRKNCIPNLVHDGRCFSAEEEKQDLIFDYYNSILGTPFGRQHTINLDGLLPQLDLNGIDACFPEEEVWEAIKVKDTPSNRAPGPDGFTAAFYKAAWPIIKADVMNAFNALWSLDARSLHLINDALMVLLRKNNALAALKDYRPISLMHSFGKLFAKCLTRRLAPRLPDMVVRNQSAFIKGRSIHDNFRAVQLACRCLHNKRFASVLLKIDIAKAFDSVAWAFLIEVMQHIGFPRRWSNWISMILSTASTKVLLNRRPGMRIIHARGVRQGDPISPMLFVITMEALNALIRREDMHRTLTPLPAPVTGHRASLYADDLVVLIAPLVDDLSCLRQILLLFAGASGLVTNEDKCVATPIRCTDEMINNVQHVFPCAVVPFPCKYLGIPLTLGRLRRADEQALVDTIAARIPTWKSGLLSVDTRREGPADEGDSICYPYAPQHCVISSWGIQQIDKRRRAFLWSGTESVTGGKCKVAWPLVCRPTDFGGLGVLDLRFFGFALRLQWEWLVRVDPSRGWAALPSRTEKPVAAMAAASMSVVGGDGCSARLWTDDWSPVGRLCAFGPDLYGALSKRGRKRTIREGLFQNQWARDIVGAPTVQVLLQYLSV
jgi:hypothetical protein